VLCSTSWPLVDKETNSEGSGTEKSHKNSANNKGAKTM
jgi:hypothetical protein